MQKIHNDTEPPDFSVVLGGPLFQLLMRLRLTTPALELLKKRITFITLIAWLPLLIFSLVDGKAWSGVEVPFLYDFEVQARFLLALPLLIAAELLIHKRLRLIVGQFVDRDIITKKELPKFKALIASAMKLRNSILIEAILLVLVFVGGHYLSNIVSAIEKIASGPGSWYATTDSTGTHISLAGYWYFFFSRPLFQFILYRWYYRLFIWIRFLWQTSRLDLNLIPIHPDRACGLGFLGMVCAALLPFIAAHGVVIAGLIANSIFFSGEKLTDSTMLIACVVLALLLVVLGPLLVFSPKIMRAKRTGLREYGILVSKYVSDFDFKWVRGGAANDERLIGNADIQSLADMGNSFQVVREIQPFPFSKEAVIQLVLFTIIPVLPLVLTMIPLEVLLKKFFEAFF